MAILINGKKVAGVGAPGANGKSAYQAAVDGGYTGTESEFNELLANGGSKPKRIPISIPTTVTGVPSDPTTYEVHLSQIGAINVSAAMVCGLYIADEAENSLTLGVSSVPEEAFQVYAIVQEVRA